MKCELCETDHDGSFGSGRFCSKKCSRSFSTSHARKEISEKTSKTLSAKKLPVEPKICIVCSNSFTPRRKSIVTCSGSCRSTHRNNLHKEKYKASIRKAIDEGRWVGWQTRNKEPSYPEKYFISLFENEKISFSREVKFGRWFADFVIGNCVVEIDGKQHDYEQRKKSDEIKDAFIRSCGYEVIRIRWFNPKTELGKDKLYPQIESMKKLLR